MSDATAWALPALWAQQTRVDLDWGGWTVWGTWHRWVAWLVLGFFGIFPLIVAYMVWAERKVAARFQDRIGPNRVGPFGLLQPIADAIKLITKESIVPRAADPFVHLLAPVLMLVSAFGVLAVVPFGVGLAPVNLPSGLLYLLAIASMSTLGVILAGWSSRNKYSLLGGMRAAAQLISYEIPQVLATVPVVLWAGSLSLTAILQRQAEFGWFLLSPPGLLGFALLMIAGIAEVNRTPFDLPEAESEIIAGYHTEYSGMRFGLFFMAEYLSVFGVCCVATVLFLGGGLLPFLSAPLDPGDPAAWERFRLLDNLILVPVFFAKVLVLIFVMFWVRATLPRMRVDRLLNFAWKYLVPLSLINIVVAAIWYECVIGPELRGTGLRRPLLGWALTLPIVALAFWGVVRLNRTPRPAPAAVPVTTAAR